MAINLHISILAEPLFHLGQLVVSNSMFTSLVVSALIIGFAVAVNRTLTSATQLKKMSAFQNVSEMLIEWLYDLIQSVTNNHLKTRRFLPLIIGYFVFILCNNWFGLLPGVGTIGFTETPEGEKHAMVLQQDLALPVSQAYASEGHAAPAAATAESGTHPTSTTEHSTGVTADSAHAPASSEEAPAHHATFVPYFRAGTADLNTTIALAVITAVSAQYWGIRYLHLSYFKKFFNFSSKIMFFVGILELISEFSKILSYAFRLFGNIFAGEVLLMVMGALAPLAVPMVFYGLEIFVGGIQALVFSLLSIIFYQVATLGHDEEH